MRSEEKTEGWILHKKSTLSLILSSILLCCALLYSFDKRSSTLMLFGLEVFPLCLYLAVQF